MRWRGAALGLAMFVVENRSATELKPTPVVVAAAGGEQELETFVEEPRPPPRPPKPPKPPPKPTPVKPKPDEDPEFPNGHPKVITPADEDLPAWCPVTGRLTVFESSDLAENLGLVPMGTFKRTGKKLSVAALMEARDHDAGLE